MWNQHISTRLAVLFLLVATVIRPASCSFCFCLNGGVCDPYVCQCLDGFTGAQCETKLTTTTQAATTQAATTQAATTQAATTQAATTQAATTQAKTMEDSWGPWGAWSAWECQKCGGCGQRTRYRMRNGKRYKGQQYGLCEDLTTPPTRCQRSHNGRPTEIIHSEKNPNRERKIKRLVRCCYTFVYGAPRPIARHRYCASKHVRGIQRIY